MRIVVEVVYRDDTKKSYDCVDNPAVSDWITLYLKNLGRKQIPRDAVKEINISVK